MTFDSIAAKMTGTAAAASIYCSWLAQRLARRPSSHLLRLQTRHVALSDVVNSGCRSKGELAVARQGWLTPHLLLLFGHEAPPSLNRLTSKLNSRSSHTLSFFLARVESDVFAVLVSCFLSFFCPSIFAVYCKFLHIFDVSFVCNFHFV